MVKIRFHHGKMLISLEHSTWLFGTEKVNFESKNTISPCLLLLAINWWFYQEKA
jgi:hypothetical protein